MIWTIAGLFAVLAGTGVAMLLWRYATAPRGYQDEQGFHYGEPGDENDEDF